MKLDHDKKEIILDTNYDELNNMLLKEANWAMEFLMMVVIIFAIWLVSFA